MRQLFLSLKAHFLRQLSISNARKHVQTITPAKNYRTSHPKQLLIDVSVIIRSDAGTGIQRVVRALLLQLLKNPPAGYIVRPIFCSRKQSYHYAPKKFGQLNNVKLEQTEKVQVNNGDIFLGLDLAAHLLPWHHAELLSWKNVGVAIHIIVYDLLPVLHPEWFNPKSTQNFHRWLKTIAIFADSAICISNTVKTDLETWLKQEYALISNNLTISTIPLGADLQNSAPSTGLPAGIEQQLASMFQQTSILMVGTLEPRKGHDQVLAAFEALWQQGHEINLIIVGKAGWKTEDLQANLNSHSQKDLRLHWLESASDELLELLYIRCDGVIAASYAEGFGLPIIEAMHFNKPILARDIPIFREIGGTEIDYFSLDLVSSIQDWCNSIPLPQDQYTQPHKYTWHDSAKQLLNNLPHHFEQTI